MFKWIVKIYVLFFYIVDKYYMFVIDGINGVINDNGVIWYDWILGINYLRK